jgi:hypothetical protein
MTHGDSDVARALEDQSEWREFKYVRVKTDQRRSVRALVGLLPTMLVVLSTVGSVLSNSPSRVVVCFEVKTPSHHCC